MDNYNELRELMELLRGNMSANDYFGDIMNMVSNMTKDKFMSDVNKVFDEYKSNSKKSMDNQINLINAMKPFMSEKQKNDIDAITKMIYDINAYQSIAKDLMNHSNNQVKTEEVDSKNSELIIEDNTVYEIDKSCTPSSYGNNDNQLLFPLLMMLLGFK